MPNSGTILKNLPVLNRFSRSFGVSGFLLVLVAHGTARADSFSIVDAPGANQTVAWSINNLGQIAGYGFYAPGNQASGFVEVKGLFTQVVYPGASQTTLSGINNGGQTVGTFATALYPSTLDGFWKVVEVIRCSVPPEQ